MSVLKISGGEMPSPSELTVNIYDITDGERDSTGTMHLDLIATKYKVEAKWNVLKQSDLAKILSAINKITFSVAFIDPTTGKEKTISAYKGDRNIPIMRVKGNDVYYKDFKVNFIEL